MESKHRIRKSIWHMENLISIADRKNVIYIEYPESVYIKLAS